MTSFFRRAPGIIIAATYDGSQMKFYIDGTLRGTTNATGTIPNGGRDIWVGSNDNWSEHFAGVIDELYIYDRALSEGEIQALMNPAPPVQHSLAANVVGNGSVGLSPSGGVYAAGTPVELTAVADAGWQFSGWSGDLTGADNPATITMDGDKSVTAIFTEVPAEQHTLTVGAVGNGSVGLSPSGGVYAAGTRVELTAVADAGWQFSGWSGDLTGADNPAYDHHGRRQERDGDLHRSACRAAHADGRCGGQRQCGTVAIGRGVRCRHAGGADGGGRCGLAVQRLVRGPDGCRQPGLDHHGRRQERDGHLHRSVCRAAHADGRCGGQRQCGTVAIGRGVRCRHAGGADGGGRCGLAVQRLVRGPDGCRQPGHDHHGRRQERDGRLHRGAGRAAHADGRRGWQWQRGTVAIGRGVRCRHARWS